MERELLWAATSRDLVMTQVVELLRGRTHRVVIGPAQSTGKL